MNNTYGFEVEFCFDRKEELAVYLQNRRNLLLDNMGCDGHGIFTGEIRSAVFDNLELFLSSLNVILKLLKLNNIKMFPVFIHDLSGKPNLYSLGFHLSIGRFDFRVMWRAFKRYIYYRFFYKDVLYNIRKKYYSEMMRIHKDRIELRFIPNYSEIILKEVKYILGVEI